MRTVLVREPGTSRTLAGGDSEESQSEEGSVKGAGYMVLKEGNFPFWKCMLDASRGVMGGADVLCTRYSIRKYKCMHNLYSAPGTRTCPDSGLVDQEQACTWLEHRVE